LTASPEAREEAEAALRTTTLAVQTPDAAKRGFSLCHGCAGNADVLLEAADTFGAAEARLTAENIGDSRI
jgi:lantibiotic biosynthesis protein